VPWRRRALVSAVLVTLLLVAGRAVFARLAAMRKVPQNVESVARPIAVRVTALHRTDFREKFIAYGRARSLLTATVAAEVTALVTWVSPKLEAGAAVAADDELVRLDNRDLRQALASHQARGLANEAEERRLSSDLRTERSKLSIVQAEVAASRRELDRIKGLQGSAAATRSDYDRQAMSTAVREAAALTIGGRIASLGAQIDRLRADRREIETNVARAQTDLSRAVIRAPFGGRIAVRHVQRGERVAPGTALFGLVDVGRVEIPVALPASRYGQVAVGAAVALRPAADRSRSWSARVVRVAPDVNAADRTFFVYVVPEAQSGASPVPPGAFVVAEIEGRLFESVYVLPRTAFVNDQVFIAKDGVARVVTPILAAELPHVLLATGGLEDGADLITTNLEEVADQTRVEAIRSEAPAKSDS